MRNASGHQCKEKMSGVGKKVNENAYDISPVKEEVTGLMAIIQRSLQLTEHASATILHKRRVAVLSKVNKACSSLGKEDFPEAGEYRFGKGFESRLKERTETAAELSEAKKMGHQLFLSNLLLGRFVLARGGSWNKGRQERRRQRPCYKPKESKLLCGFPTFKKGGNSYDKRLQRRLYGLWT